MYRDDHFRTVDGIEKVFETPKYGSPIGKFFHKPATLIFIGIYPLYFMK